MRDTPILDFLSLPAAPRSSAARRPLLAAPYRLAMLFALAMLALALFSGALAAALSRSLAGDPPGAASPFAVATLAIVLCAGGLWRCWRDLAAHDCSLRSRLDARAPDQNDPLARVLREVAEEAALATGLPVPALYVLEDASINALVLGARPATATVLVTRGALERLDRRQLRAVVARQILRVAFSDIALELRLAAVMSMLAPPCRSQPRSACGTRRAPSRSSAIARLVALPGSPLLLASRLLPLALGHRRDFLADALAARLTGNRAALVEALERIAEADRGATGSGKARVRGQPASPLTMVAHLMFVQPASLSRVLDSHPSLSRRIARLRSFADEPATGQPGGPSGASPLPATPLAALVARLRRHAHSREVAAGWLCALVLARPGAVPALPQGRQDAAALRWLLSPAGAPVRLPMLELMIARLGYFDGDERRAILDRCRRALGSDAGRDAAAWARFALVRHRLLLLACLAGGREQPPAGVTFSGAIAVLFAAAAAVGQASARTTRDRLAETAALLAVPAPPATPDEIDVEALADALDTLVRLPPRDKPVLLTMLARMARTPGEPEFQQFAGAVAAAIDSPLRRWHDGRLAPAAAVPTWRRLDAALAS